MVLLTKFLLTSSWAFSAFLSPRSSELTASFSAFTNSAGLFCDFPNSGIVMELQVVACTSTIDNEFTTVRSNLKHRHTDTEWPAKIVTVYKLDKIETSHLRSVAVAEPKKKTQS